MLDGQPSNVAFTLLDLPGRDLKAPSNQRNCFRTGQSQTQQRESLLHNLANHCFPNVEFFTLDSRMLLALQAAMRNGNAKSNLGILRFSFLGGMLRVARFTALLLCKHPAVTSMHFSTYHTLRFQRR